MATHRDFISLAKTLGKFSNNIKLTTGQKVQAIGNKIIEGVADITPKDTGRATYAWQVEFDSPPASSNIEKRDTPPVNADTAAAELKTRGKAKIKDFKYPINSMLYVTNYLDYMQYLDRGWSDQAPANFIKGIVVAAVAGTRHIKVTPNPLYPNVLE